MSNNNILVKSSTTILTNKRFITKEEESQKKEPAWNRMYKTGLKKIESVNYLARARKKEIEEKEMQGVTFIPTINRNSRTDGKLPKKVGDRLYSYKKIQENKLYSLQNTTYEESQSKCTFHPQIESKLIFH